MISNQFILDHCVNYFHDRIVNNKPFINGWGSKDNPDSRCAIGSLDNITTKCSNLYCLDCKGNTYCYNRCKEFLGISPYAHTLVQVLMYGNDLWAICGTPSLSEMIGQLEKIAGTFNLKLNLPKGKSIKESEKANEEQEVVEEVL